MGHLSPLIRSMNGQQVEKWVQVLMADGETLTIRGVEYVVKNDELPIPDDPKGETKIDALGHLKGGKSASSPREPAEI